MQVATADSNLIHNIKVTASGTVW